MMDEILNASDEEVEAWEKMILRLRADWEEVAAERGRLPIKQVKSLYKSVCKVTKPMIGFVYK